MPSKSYKILWFSGYVCINILIGYISLRFPMLWFLFVRSCIVLVYIINSILPSNYQQNVLLCVWVRSYIHRYFHFIMSAFECPFLFFQEQKGWLQRKSHSKSAVRCMERNCVKRRKKTKYVLLFWHFQICYFSPMFS